MKENIDEFDYHEVLDRLYIIEKMTNDLLLTHPIVGKHDDVKKKIKKAGKNLADAYQLVGALRFEHES